MNISNNDYLVLTVKDFDVTVAFYESVLGILAKTFGEGRGAPKLSSQKINLHKHGQEFESQVNKPLPVTVACFIYMLSYA